MLCFIHLSVLSCLLLYKLSNHEFVSYLPDLTLNDGAAQRPEVKAEDF